MNEYGKVLYASVSSVLKPYDIPTDAMFTEKTTDVFIHSCSTAQDTPNSNSAPRGSRQGPVCEIGSNPKNQVAAPLPNRCLCVPRSEG